MAIGNTVNQEGYWGTGSEEDPHPPRMAWMQFPDVVGILPWATYLDHSFLFSWQNFNVFEQRHWEIFGFLSINLTILIYLLFFWVLNFTKI
jgi:hypothetical protein